MLAALLEGQRQVVQAARGVVGVEWLVAVAAGGPVIGRSLVIEAQLGVAAGAGDADALVGRDPGGVEQVVGGGRLGGHAGLLAGGLGEGGEDLGRVVQLDQLGGALDDLGLGVPLAGDLVLVARARTERAIRRDRQVVRVVVDQHQPAGLVDAPLVGGDELHQLLAGVGQEGGALEGGLGGNLAEHARSVVHAPRSFLALGVAIIVAAAADAHG